MGADFADTDAMRTLLHLRPTVAASAVALAACASAQPADTLSPFTSDGCSLFPDRSLVSKADWCNCCFAHDLAYWRGGTAPERLAADEQLRSCVLQATGNAGLADLMFTGVRAGGGPHFYTPYRWAYGWAFGRGYRPLSIAEQEVASSLQAQFLASNPPQACSKPRPGIEPTTSPTSAEATK